MIKETLNKIQNPVGRKNDPVFPTLSAPFPSWVFSKFDCLLTNIKILAFFRKNDPNQDGGVLFFHGSDKNNTPSVLKDVNS